MGMVQLHDKYAARGFQVVGVPCNQFGGQEPNSNAVIEAFAATKSSFAAAPCETGLGCPFPMLAKSTVNEPMCTNVGKDHCDGSSDQCCGFNNPVYEYLRGQLPGNIPWNFAKFLVDTSGNVVSRYRSVTEPSDMEPDILPLLPPLGSGH